MVRKRKKCLRAFKESIQEHKDELWIPGLDIAYDSVPVSGWFDILKHSSSCNLQHSKIYDSFTLYVPERIDYIDEPKPNEIVSIDPGLRTFACCL